MTILASFVSDGEDFGDAQSGADESEKFNDKITGADAMRGLGQVAIAVKRIVKITLSFRISSACSGLLS